MRRTDGEGERNDVCFWETNEGMGMGMERRAVRRGVSGTRNGGIVGDGCRGGDGTRDGW